MPNMANICKLLSVFVALDMFSGIALAESSEELREPATLSTIAARAAHSRGLYPIFAWFTVQGERSAFFIAVQITVALVIIAKHTPNINRLLRGTESRLGAKTTA